MRQYEDFDIDLLTQKENSTGNTIFVLRLVQHRAIVTLMTIDFHFVIMNLPELLEPKFLTTKGVNFFQLCCLIESRLKEKLPLSSENTLFNQLSE